MVSKADRTEVSHAIKTNENEETKTKQMVEINSNIKLVDYYDGFVFTFSQSYTTSQAILSGKLSLNTGNLGVTLASQALSLIPFCGSVVGAGAQAVGDFVISARFTKNASKFAKLASNHTELDKIVEKVAREVVLHPEKKSILTADQAEKVTSGWFKGLAQKCKKFGVEVNEKLYGDRYETPAAKMGYKDACSLIDLYTSGKIVVDTGSSLEECFIRATLSPPVDSNQCVTMMVTGIKFDNPLLNHSELLEAFNQTYGFLVTSRLIDLTGELVSAGSGDVIEEVCNGGNAICMLGMLAGE